MTHVGATRPLMMKSAGGAAFTVTARAHARKTKSFMAFCEEKGENERRWALFCAISGSAVFPTPSTIPRFKLFSETLNEVQLVHELHHTGANHVLQGCLVRWMESNGFFFNFPGIYSEKFRFNIYKNWLCTSLCYRFRSRYP